MSVFNGERWLAESIQSVLNQTFMDFEFIIVNDGSTDQSLNIIKNYANLDSRIRVFDKPNTGLADSLNYGLARSTGAWVARIDADDVSMPKRLEKQIEFVERANKCVLIGTGLILIDESGTKGSKGSYPNDHDLLLKNFSEIGAVFPHASAFFDREVALSIGGYRSRISRAEDIDLWLRLAAKGKIACLSEPLVLIRKHDDQISHDEAGRRQLIDAHLSMVSYWLRNMNRTDPVEAASGIEFEIFRSWISDQLHKFGFFEQKAFLERLKYEILSADSRISKTRIILVSVLHHPLYAIRWFIARYWGSRLPRKLAQDWLAR